MMVIVANVVNECLNEGQEKRLKANGVKKEKERV
jgi:hypothetical protein